MFYSQDNIIRTHCKVSVKTKCHNRLKDLILYKHYWYYSFFKMDTRSASYTKCPMILQLSSGSRTARKSQWNPVRLNRVSSTSLIFDEISSAGCFCSPASARCLTALNCNLNFPLQLMVGMFSLVMSDNLKLFARKILL